MDISMKKKEIIDWVNQLSDVSVLYKIEKIKSTSSFDFDDAWGESLEINNARQKTQEFLKSLPWKK